MTAVEIQRSLTVVKWGSASRRAEVAGAELVFAVEWDRTSVQPAPGSVGRSVEVVWKGYNLVPAHDEEK